LLVLVISLLALRLRRSMKRTLIWEGTMAPERHIYSEINSQTDLQNVFSAIRCDVAGAGSRPALTELYKRAGYLITLLHAPSWEKKFGPAAAVRKIAEHEFSITAQRINRRARQIGTEPDYDETWAQRGAKEKRRSSMPKPPRAAGYRPTKAKYKGGAKEMYVTYDLPQKREARSPASTPPGGVRGHRTKLKESEITWPPQDTQPRSRLVKGEDGPSDSALAASSGWRLSPPSR
jgi:hypothetical protein